MKRFSVLLSILLSSIVFSGCFSDTPKCGDKNVVNAVEQFIESEVKKEVGIEKGSRFNYFFESIKTIKISNVDDEKNKAIQCSANLKAVNIQTNQSKNLPITYRAERIGEDEKISVQVDGLII